MAYRCSVVVVGLHVGIYTCIMYFHSPDCRRGKISWGGASRRMSDLALQANNIPKLPSLALKTRPKLLITMNWYNWVQFDSPLISFFLPDAQDCSNCIGNSCRP